MSAGTAGPGRPGSGPAAGGARLEHLAAAAAGTTCAHAPAEVRQRVRDLVVDTLAVTAWGSRRGELRALRELVADTESHGRATVLGTSITREAALACALNGSAAAADQLQDGHRVARGHPGSHVVLAVFALAEERDCSAQAMLSAVLAAYEVGARIGTAMRGTPPGVHDIGTWGAVAAAAGTAHLLAPGDASAMAAAIELGSSAILLTDAETVFGGHPGGHAFLGASVAHGLWLGQAAASGLRAAPGTLDRLLGRHAAADWAGLPVGDADGWQAYEVMRGYLKLHPACAHLHGVLDALDDILSTHRASHSAADVEHVLVRTYAAASAFAAPADNELQARFSIPTAVALALRHGRLTEDVLTDSEVRSRAVRELAARVEVTHAPELDAGYPDGRPSSVELTLSDGTSVSAHSARPRGYADGAASRPALRAKAERLLRGSFGDSAAPLQQVLAEWPERHSPRQLGLAFRRAAAGAEGGRPPAPRAAGGTGPEAATRTAHV
ncbi:MAG TPA: MmgE/PrpD family protein [Intrasporangium sp.]|uniref:MmgE/PrpD family protein n=1 Tax=Intrasporangium sp. TaxID=1925024 RepID=UPI002D79F042|nr:MmgE/PrpD family protein [Intrasporangium sp.]HET7400090.1 MmgE/PrpD family protein [Intrasporangium sp.]